MGEQQPDVATEAALAVVLGMEAGGSSFLQGIDPGMRDTHADILGGP